MELTNYSAIDIRGQFHAAETEYARTLERLSTGKRVNRSGDDSGVIAIAMKKHSDLTRNHSIRTGIQNAISFAQLQHEGLNQVGEIYNRMGELAQSSLDIVKNNDDRGLLDKEFNEMVERLVKIRVDKFNGVPLFDPLVSCDGGAPIDFSDGLNEQMPSDFRKVAGPSGTRIWNDMWETEADTHAYEGKLTLKVNGGSAEERYVVSWGNTPIFDTGEWKSRGNAYQYDFDQFEIEIAAGKPTTYTYTELDTGGWGGVANPGVKADGSNPTGTPSAPNPNGTLDNAAGNYGEGGTRQTGAIQLQDAPAGATNLKIQIYSDTLFQADARFDPVVVNNDQVVLTDVRGETMTIGSLGFGTMAGFSVKTVADAQSTLEKLYGKTGDGTQEGEVHCLLTEQQSKAAAHISRLNSAMDKLRVNQVNEERVLSTLEDLDFATESTRLARHSLKLDVLNNLLATATRMTDVLMPLATQRPGSS